MPKNNIISESKSKWKTLHFMTFCTCDFITDWSIASYQRNFLVEPSLRQVCCPFVIQFQAKYHASWCSTKSLWYCREVRKQSDKWNVMLQVLYHLPFKFFSCCGPLYISLNSISTCQSVTFEPWGAHQKLPRRKETHRCWIHEHFSRFFCW